MSFSVKGAVLVVNPELVLSSKIRNIDIHKSIVVEVGDGGVKGDSSVTRDVVCGEGLRKRLLSKT